MFDQQNVACRIIHPICRSVRIHSILATRQCGPMISLTEMVCGNFQKERD